MKIISNFKDYYDFLTGIYGIDEKCVYERICSTEDQDGKWHKTGVFKPKHTEPGTVYSFDILAVCGTMYCCYYYNGRLYFGEEAVGVIPKVVKNNGFFNNDFYGHMYDVSTYSDIYQSGRSHLKKTDLNERENCPVLIISHDRGAHVKKPKLSDYDFGKVLSAEECYVQISNFLSREKPVNDNRTDIQKIIGKGFDKKTSFRNIK